MSASEVAQRYAQGESISALAREYHMSWDRVASLLAHMDAHGPRCVRCEVLLAKAPRWPRGVGGVQGRGGCADAGRSGFLHGVPRRVSYGADAGGCGEDRQWVR
jgi:hypothetical protein